MNVQKFDAALSQQDEDITRIQIDVIGPDHFRWTLYERQRVIYSDTGDHREVGTMILCCEMLVNIMLGNRPRGERWQPWLN
jgi:hypothetical protein